MPVCTLKEIMPSHEFSWWKALAKVRFEEQEAERTKAASRRGLRGGTMGRGSR